MEQGSTFEDETGFSLIELLIVVLLLGIMASIVVFSVRGLRDDSQESTCSQHRRVVGTAIESYFAGESSATLPSFGAPDLDQYERGLVQAQYMRDISVYYDIDVNGGMTPEAGSPCP